MSLGGGDGNRLEIRVSALIHQLVGDATLLRFIAKWQKMPEPQCSSWIEQQPKWLWGIMKFNEDLRTNEMPPYWNRYWNNIDLNTVFGFTQKLRFDTESPFISCCQRIVTCSFHEEDWQYTEAATGEAAKQDYLEARRSRPILFGGHWFGGQRKLSWQPVDELGLGCLGVLGDTLFSV